MNQYAQVAINTVIASRNSKKIVNDLWDLEATNIIAKESTRRKSCPKGAFLGLCENGNVAGINSGKYTSSNKNKQYAIDALNILKNHKNNPNRPMNPNTINSCFFSIDPIVLWNMLPNRPETHNSQMYIVCELWNSGLIN